MWWRFQVFSSRVSQCLPAVAQIFNLLYRRIGFGGEPNGQKALELRGARRLEICDTAEYNSALRVAGLSQDRAGRLPALPVGRILLPLIFLVALCGCRTVPTLAVADLSEPGWQVHQGQAVWKPNKESPEIAGELLVAVRNNGEAFVQFTKTPFTLVTARRSGEGWRVEFPPSGQTHGGRGSPPDRLIWFHLPKLVGGQPLPKNYSVERNDSTWRLENRPAGEFLEGYLNPP